MDDSIDGRDLTVAKPQALVQVAPTSMAGLLGVEERRQIAEVMARMLKAQLAPRMHRMDTIEKMVMNECSAQHLAEMAVYQYSRGGTEVSGPSIRLVEMISRHWGNIDSGISILHRGVDAGGVSFTEARAEAVDMETGRRDYRDFVVRHWRDRKGGGYAVTDERDISEMIYSQGQRRKRACLLSMLPTDLVDQAVAQCDRTLAADASLSSKEALQKMVTMFAPMGVTQKQIETFCQCRLEAIKPAQVVRLRKIWVSINDGMSTAESWFGKETAWDEVEQRHEETRRRQTTKDRSAAGAVDGGEAKGGEGAKGTASPSASPPATEAKQEAAPEPPPPTQAPPATAQAPAFDYPLFDGSGEPIGEDMFTDPAAFVKALMVELERPHARKEGLLEHNADAIEDARSAWTYELSALMEPPKEEAPPPVDPIPLQMSSTSGAPLWPLYMRQFTETMKNATVGTYLDICANEHSRIEVAPTAIKGKLLKLTAETAQALGVPVPEFAKSIEAAKDQQPEQKQAERPAPAKGDKDAEYCAAHCAEMDKLESLQALGAFVQHPAISRRFQQWTKERPELAELMRDAQKGAEQRLRAGA